MSSELAPMDRIDAVEARMVEMGARIAGVGESPFPVTHHFTPGLYSREIFMPAGAVVVSKIHRTEHPFVVSKGRCLVYRNQNEWDRIEAPYFGVTKPGTRRVLLILEDTIWTTFHPTELTDVAEIEAAIIEPHINRLLEAPQ